MEPKKTKVAVWLHIHLEIRKYVTKSVFQIFTNTFLPYLVEHYQGNRPEGCRGQYRD